MSGFVFTPQNADADAQPVEAPDLVKGDGFWPDINITNVRDVVRLDTTITPARLRDAVRQAMLDIAAALADWRASQEAAGISTLSDVPSRMKVDGVSDYVLRWSRAVYSVVGADLDERLVSQSATAAGVDRAQALGQDVLVHQRNVSFAVRDFLGRPRIRARMI